jgi:hypothetical protein
VEQIAMRGAYSKLIIVVACVAATLALPQNKTHAASRLSEDLADLFRAAEVVVESEVIRCAPGEQTNAGAEIPLTNVTLKVNRVFKGAVSPDEILHAEFVGGGTGELQTIAPGQPCFLPGTRVIVMLSKFGRLQNWRVIGGDAGEIEFGFGDDGMPMARRACGARFDYFITDPHSLTGFKPMSATELSEGLVLKLVEAIAATGRPVVEARVLAAQAPKPTSAPAQRVSIPAAHSASGDAAVALGHTAARGDDGVQSTPYTRVLGSFVLSVLAWVIGRHCLLKLRANK